MKRCSKCRVERLLSAFARNKNTKDGYQCWCRSCKAQMQDDRANKIREIIRQAKDRPCMDCNESFPTFVMDFDHRGDKRFNIGSSVTRRSIKQMQEEIAKCDVVCANCHRIRTFRLTN